MLKLFSLTVDVTPLLRSSARPIDVWLAVVKQRNHSLVLCLRITSFFLRMVDAQQLHVVLYMAPQPRFVRSFLSSLLRADGRYSQCLEAPALFNLISEGLPLGQFVIMNNTRAGVRVCQDSRSVLFLFLHIECTSIKPMTKQASASNDTLESSLHASIYNHNSIDIIVTL